MDISKKAMKQALAKFAKNFDKIKHLIETINEGIFTFIMKKIS